MLLERLHPRLILLTALRKMVFSTKSLVIVCIEEHPTITHGHNVIQYVCGCYDALRLTRHAKRLFTQMVSPYLLP